MVGANQCGRFSEWTSEHPYGESSPRYKRLEWLSVWQLIKVAPRVSRPFLDEGPFCMENK